MFIMSMFNRFTIPESAAPFFTSFMNFLFFSFLLQSHGLSPYTAAFPVALVALYDQFSLYRREGVSLFSFTENLLLYLNYLAVCILIAQGRKLQGLAAGLLHTCNGQWGVLLTLVYLRVKDWI